MKTIVGYDFMWNEGMMCVRALDAEGNQTLLPPITKNAALDMLQDLSHQISIACADVDESAAIAGVDDVFGE